MQYEHELQAALQAASLAGKLILDHYTRFERIPDAPSSITTETDCKSQEIILQYLHRAFPVDALRAEESTPTLRDVPDAGPRLWIIDPIDGTRGFARKTGEFSIMIALVEDGRVAVGVVAEPAFARLTYAVAGQGCWRRDGEREEPLVCRVTKVAELGKASLTQSHSHNPVPPSRFLRGLAPARVTETYSAGIKLALVARGEADLYLNTYDACHDWDICAGQILVEEAGGRVTNLGGEAPQYGLPGAVQYHGLLASNGILHDPALRALARISE